MILRILGAASASLRTVAAVYTLAWGAWWCVLCLLAIPGVKPRTDRLASRSWLVIVPAHNEEQLVEACVKSLLRSGAGLPAAPTVLVIADNCDDRTATISRVAGAVVYERTDPVRRGKGYALEDAISGISSGSLGLPVPDFVAFVDADSLVDAAFLPEMQRELARGARVAQAYYEVADDGELTRLRRLAFKLLHWGRPLGMARLGLGSGLKGNGMAMRWEIATEGLGSVGIAEDAAMTLAAAERGIPVAFVPRARVSGFMASTYADARVQDERWERGRLRMMPRAVAAALRALRRGQVGAAAGALDVAAPPLTLVVGLASALGFLQVVHPVRRGWLSIAAFVSVGLYVPLGLIASRASWREVSALAMAPRFVLYKVVVLAGSLWSRQGDEWRRTNRTR